MKLGEAQNLLRQLENEYDLKRTVKQSMELPANAPIALFSRFATPDGFRDGNDDPVTRENATSNLSQTDFEIVVAAGSIRANFIRMLRTEYPDDGNIKKVVDMIGDDVIIRATSSKGKSGWLGNLIITSRRLAEVATASFKDAGKSMFRRGK